MNLTDAGCVPPFTNWGCPDIRYSYLVRIIHQDSSNNPGAKITQERVYAVTPGLSCQAHAQL